MFHEESTETSEQHDAKGDKIEVIPANFIQPRVWIVVRESKELQGVWARLREEGVGKKDQGNDVERET